LIGAFRTGQWSVPGLVVDRSKQPVKFYIAVLSFSFLFVVLTFASCLMLKFWLSKALF
jgi:hypothetical protein